MNKPEGALMSPFLATPPPSSRPTDQSLALSPFLVQHHDHLSLGDMKKLMEMFGHGEAEVDTGSRHPSSPPPRVTTYRPVPDYVSSGAGQQADIATLLADLILDTLEAAPEDSRLLGVLAALAGREPQPEVTTTRRPAAPSLPQVPGPPYLQSSYLPPHSLVTRPPRPRPQQPLFQTQFSAAPPTKFTQTYPDPFPRPGKKFNSGLTTNPITNNKNLNLNKMIEELISDVDVQKANDNVGSDRYKYQKKRRKPFQPRPQKQQSVDVVVRKEKPQRRPVPSPVRDPRPVRGSSDRSPFSRYPVRVPQTSAGPSDHFSLPIDSLANINIRPQQRTGPVGAGSFEDTLTKMLQDLGNINLQVFYLAVIFAFWSLFYRNQNEGRRFLQFS